MKRKVIKISMMFGFPLGMWFILWGLGTLAHKYNIFFIEISARGLPVAIAGILSIFFGGVILGIAYGLLRLGYAGAEEVLKWIEHKLERRRINRLSQHDSPLPEDLSQAQRTEMLRNFEQDFQVQESEPDEDRAYRERIGIEEDGDRTLPPGRGRGGVNTFG